MEPVTLPIIDVAQGKEVKKHVDAGLQLVKDKIKKLEDSIAINNVHGWTQMVFEPRTVDRNICELVESFMQAKPELEKGLAVIAEFDEHREKNYAGWLRRLVVQEKDKMNYVTSAVLGEQSSSWKTCSPAKREMVEDLAMFFCITRWNEFTATMRTADLKNTSVSSLVLRFIDDPANRNLLDFKVKDHRMLNITLADSMRIRAVAATMLWIEKEIQGKRLAKPKYKQLATKACVKKQRMNDDDDE